MTSHERRLPKSAGPGHRARPEWSRRLRLFELERGQGCRERSTSSRGARFRHVGAREQRRSARSRLASAKARNGCRPGRPEPGSSLGFGGPRRSAAAIDPDMGRARARVSRGVRTDRRRHGHERKVHDRNLVARDAYGLWTKREARGEHRCASHCRARERDRCDGLRHRSLELSTHDHPQLSAGRGRAARHKPRPSRLAPELRGLPEGQSAHFREPARGRLGRRLRRKYGDG